MSSLPPLLRRRGVRVAAIVLAVLVVVRALLPVAAERALERAVGDAAGLTARIDDVDLGILAGTVAVEGLVLGAGAVEETPAEATTPQEAPPDEKPAEAPPPEPAREAAAEPPPLLRFDRLIVDLRWLGLAAGRIHLATVALEGPAIHVETDARGRFLLPTGSPEAADAPGEADAPEPASGTEDTAEPAADEGAGPETAQGAEPVTAEGAEPAAEEAGWPLRVDRLLIDGATATVASPSADAPALEVAFAGFELEALRRDAQGISFSNVALREPRVRARRGFLLNRPADSEPAPPADAAPDGPEGPGETYQVRQLAVESGELTLTTAAGDLETFVELSAREIDTSEGARFPVTLAIRVDEGTFRVEGEASASPPGFAGTVTWKDLPIPPLLLAAQPDLHRWVRSCRATGELEIEASLGGGPDAPVLTRVAGSASVDGFHFEDPGGEDLSVRWRALEVGLSELALPAGGDGSRRTRIVLSRLRLVEPRVEARLPVESLDALSGDDGAEDEGGEAEAQGPPPHLAVESLELVDGRVLLVDRTVEPAVRAKVRGIELEASGLEPGEPAVQPVDLEGRTLGGAPFSLTGKLAEEGGALRFDLERIPLSPLNPYAVDSGYRVREGDASIETRLTVDGETLRLDNGLVLHDLRVSRVSESARLDGVIGMPVDLAIALLKDVGGDISLSVPVSFDPGGMKVSIATVLRDALRGAIAGAVTSPLKVMGAAIDLGKGVAAGDPLRLDPLEFRPGTAELTDAMAEDVEALAFMLERHPALGVVLRGSADPEADREGLALRILAERAAADQDLPDVDVDGVGFIDRIQLGSALEDHAGGKPLDLGDDERRLLEAWQRTVYVPAERLDALARERAEAARRALLTGHAVEPARVRASDETGRGKPGVRISFEVAGGS